MTVGSSSVVRLLSEISWWKEPRTKEENLTFATVEFCNPLCWICWNVQAFKITSSPTYRNLRAVCVCAFFMHICHCGGFCAVVIRWMLFFLFVCVLHRTPVCLSLSLFPFIFTFPLFFLFRKKKKKIRYLSAVAPVTFSSCGGETGWASFSLFQFSVCMFHFCVQTSAAY